MINITAQLNSSTLSQYDQKNNQPSAQMVDSFLNLSFKPKKQVQSGGTVLEKAMDLYVSDKKRSEQLERLYGLSSKENTKNSTEKYHISMPFSLSHCIHSDRNDSRVIYLSP